MAAMNDNFGKSPTAVSVIANVENKKLYYSKKLYYCRTRLFNLFPSIHRKTGRPRN
jgi:hypothetical protein